MPLNPGPNYIKDSLSKAKSCTSSKEIHCLLQNPDVHYHVHRSLPPVPDLCYTNLGHCPGCNERNCTNLSQHSQVYSQDLNLVPPQYETEYHQH
jgi:hypothetical protein